MYRQVIHHIYKNYYQGTHRGLATKYANMELLKTEILSKYEIFDEFLTEMWDKYGSFIVPLRVSKYLNCLSNCI